MCAPHRRCLGQAGAFYLDQYAATKAAAFQAAPAIKFAQGSTFHYLNASRYLMAQTLLHLLQLLTHGAPPSPRAGESGRRLAQGRDLKPQQLRRPVGRAGAAGGGERGVGRADRLVGSGTVGVG